MFTEYYFSPEPAFTLTLCFSKSVSCGLLIFVGVFQRFTCYTVKYLYIVVLYELQRECFNSTTRPNELCNICTNMSNNMTNRMSFEIGKESCGIIERNGLLKS